MAFFRKKSMIYELPITKQQLQDACVLASLFHCMKTAKFPDASKEQIWKEKTYIIHRNHGQGAMHFFSGGFIAAFSNENKEDHHMLQDLPFKYRIIAKNEILPYISTPSMTFLWGDEKNTFSFDEETALLNKGENMLTPYLLDEKEAMTYWKTIASCDRDEVRFVKELWKHYKLNKEFTDCFVETDSLPFAYPPEGLLALKEGLAQLTVANDIQVRKDIIERNKRGETYPYYILSKRCVSLSLLYSFRQDLFSPSVSLSWENSRFTYTSENTTCIFYFTGQSYVGALLTKEKIKKCYRLPQYITDLFEKEPAFTTYVQAVAKQGQTHITYFWAEMNTLYMEADASVFFSCDHAFMKQFLGASDMLWRQLSSAQQALLSSILNTYLKVDLITLKSVSALIKEKQVKTLKIKDSDIQSCGFQKIRKDILTDMSIEVV